MRTNSLPARLLVGLALLSIGAFSIFLVLAIQSKVTSDTAFAQNLIRLHVIAHSNSPTDQN